MNSLSHGLDNLARAAAGVFPPDNIVGDRGTDFFQKNGDALERFAAKGSLSGGQLEGMRDMICDIQGREGGRRAELGRRC